jgi:hypothetical protein
MERPIGLAMSVVGLALLETTADAQVTLAALRGKVADEQGGVMPGVTVTARHVATNSTKTVVTNVAGQRERLALLHVGEIDVQLRHDDHRRGSHELARPE